MADEMITALRALANRWALKARDYARAAKDESVTGDQASYNRGVADGYYKAATELAALLKDVPAPREPARPREAPREPTRDSSREQGGRWSVSMPSRPTSPPAAPAASTNASNSSPSGEVYTIMSVGEVLSILEFSGVNTREIIENKDNSFRAIFSRWENMMPHDRIERIQKADPRIVVLGNGKLESHDHFVEFAFKES